jgi:putative oxidoreductase
VPTSHKFLLLLEPLQAAADYVLLAMRLVVGAFLIWGVWDNIVSAERMAEFENFLRQHGFPQAQWLAPLSVWAQFACGLAFVLGLGTRWAGLLCAFNFLVALVVVDAKTGLRGALPSTLLMLLGLYFATRGAGRFGLDAHLRGYSRNQPQ